MIWQQIIASNQKIDKSLENNNIPRKIVCGIDRQSSRILMWIRVNLSFAKGKITNTLRNYFKFKVFKNKIHEFINKNFT